MTTDEPDRPQLGVQTEPIPDQQPGDEDVVMAAAELVGRTPAVGFNLGVDEPEQPGHVRTWYAEVVYPDRKIVVEGQPNLASLCEQVVVRLIDGSDCPGCGKTVTVLGGDGTPIRQTPAGPRGPCGWLREGPRWGRWCGDRQPGDTVREKLAQALVEAGVDARMVGAARAGMYGQRSSPLPFPDRQLVADLRGCNTVAALALIGRVEGGEFADDPALPSRAPRTKPTFGGMLSAMLANQRKGRDR